MDNASQIQQEIIDDETTDLDHMIVELNDVNDPNAILLADALNDFFNDLEEIITTEAILNDDDIINLIRKENEDENENDSS